MSTTRDKEWGPTTLQDLAGTQKPLVTQAGETPSHAECSQDKP